PTLKGFETGGANITFGVNVGATFCGVYAESDPSTPAGRPPAPVDNSSDRVGVCGVARSFGVLGDGDLFAGVWGQSGTPTGAGVVGVGKDENVTGVLGVAIDQRHQEEKVGNPSHGVGVVGISESAEGFGVQGLSVQPKTTPGVVPAAGKGNGAGTGVQGES